MNPIIEKQDLSENIVRMVIAAPDIARKRRAGQFIILKMDEKGEWIPLTIVDSDAAAGGVIRGQYTKLRASPTTDIPPRIFLFLVRFIDAITIFWSDMFSRTQAPACALLSPYVPFRVFGDQCESSNFNMFWILSFDSMTKWWQFEFAISTLIC